MLSCRDLVSVDLADQLVEDRSFISRRELFNEKLKTVMLKMPIRQIVERKTPPSVTICREIPSRPPRQSHGQH